MINVGLFHVTPESAGGIIQFNYTVNNWRGQSITNLNFNPGKTTKTYTFP
jgi:hypothetical protein